jgi:hypothetical protein
VFYISNIVPAKTKKAKKVSHSIVKRVKHGIKLAVVPHSKNDYRPHLVRRYGLLAIMFISIGLQLGYNGALTGNVLGRQSDITVNSLLYQTNLLRTQASKPSLKLNKKLNEAAYLKIQDMFDKQYWSHNSPDGTQPWKWFGDVDYNYSEAGENLAKNFTTTNSVMTAWMDSPEHKKNVLKTEYQDVGFAVMDGELDGKPTSLVVALYGQPSEGIVAGVQTAFTVPDSGQSNILTQFAVAAQSLTPAVIGSLALIAGAMIVAAYAHAYRRKLPKKLRKSWYLHHGLYKAVGLLSFGVILVLMYGGGQI